ncbi:MAG: DUF3991 domain-containing protein [Syntrophorhabdus sp.]|nr:DUF3991 domain-containing protein [Syntrophorhabdus sp.]
MRPTHHNNDEIKIINATVDIGQVAEALGFAKDRAKSSKMSHKYTRDGDRIVVKDSPSRPGQEYYTLGKSKEEGDCGPVFNFVYWREGERNLGKTRKILKPFIGTLDAALVTPVTVPSRMIEEEAPDRSSEWEALSETPMPLKRHVVDHLYKMGITRETLEAFRGLLHADAMKNACFASRLQDGRIVGWSVRGTQDKKFRSNHGTKALFFGPPGKERTEHLVVTESALDALSYWQIFHEQVDIMVSATNGNTGDYGQVVLLARELGAQQIIVATDNDEAGEEQGKALAAVLDNAGVPWFYHRPPGGTKDWNKYLLQQKEVTA